MTDSSVDRAARLAWFRDARFGMFITWGLYALPGHGEWAMICDAIPAEEYARLADRFNPRRFDADAWAELAVAAGMKYGVFVTRHGDGFCLFDSRHSVGNFTSTATRAGRDLVAEYVEAFRRRGLGVGLYYHIGDWREPAYFDPRRHPESAARMVASTHRQVEELMTNYGKIDILWYDGWYWEHARDRWPGLPREVAIDFWRSHELNAMVRRLQPHILINDRSGPREDFGTPEQRVEAAESGRAWETCMTIGSQWGYTRYEPQRKTVPQLLQQLVEAVSQGGNFLLNVGPTPDGTICREEASRLLEIGCWLQRHGEAVYGADLGPAPQWWYLNGRCAQRGNTLYYYLYQWKGCEAVMIDLEVDVRSARILATGQPVGVRRSSNGRLTLTGLPARPPDPHVNVIALECASPPRRTAEAAPCWWTGEGGG
ncbi:MAG: alpha-L-fucosidase, partial [Armatimonadota bacterium]